MKEKLLNRFLKYIRFHTESEAFISQIPSTKRQFDLANYLVAELNSLGLTEITLDENCYIQATLPANINEKVPVIGFIAHMDTSPDFTGLNVNPKIIENYDGSIIKLNEEYNLNPKEFPKLTDYIGQTLITTDGTTLLGADDKAGIAEIVTAIEYLLAHPEIKHGTLKIGFTPDEEVGRGAELFDVEKFGADWAYTLDGGEVGELEFENFNAAYAKITIKGKIMHPGSAKHKMINAMQLAMQYASMLPPDEVPELTEGYEGFFHLTKCQGSVEQATLEYIIRDHDKDQFEARKKLMQELVIELNKEIGKELLQITLKDQYKNMREKIEPVMHIVDLAQNAMIQANIKPLLKPIRGGTDGAQLSYKGLPCPNIFAGGLNFHGRYEFIPLESMEKATQVILNIVQNIAKTA